MKKHKRPAQASRLLLMSANNTVKFKLDSANPPQLTAQQRKRYQSRINAALREYVKAHRKAV